MYKFNVYALSMHEYTFNPTSVNLKKSSKKGLDTGLMMCYTINNERNQQKRKRYISERSSIHD